MFYRIKARHCRSAPTYYGTATGNGLLRYARTQTIELPLGVDGLKLSGTARDSSVSAPGSAPRYAIRFSPPHTPYLVGGILVTPSRRFQSGLTRSWILNAGNR